jgi:hypothetical protein
MVAIASDASFDTLSFAAAVPYVAASATVLSPPMCVPPPPRRTHTHSLAHKHARSLTHTHSLAHTRTRSHIRTHSLTHTHTLTLTHTHSRPCCCCGCGSWCWFWVAFSGASCESCCGSVDSATTRSLFHFCIFLSWPCPSQVLQNDPRRFLYHRHAPLPHRLLCALACVRTYMRACVRALVCCIGCGCCGVASMV